MTPWFWLLLATLVGSAFFAGSETAVVSSDRVRQRAASERKRPLAGLAERLYTRPHHTLVVLLLGNNLVNILASICALMLTEAAFRRAGANLPVYWSDLISSIWIALLVLLMGEILPKSIGRQYALRLTRLVAPLLLVLRLVLRPLFWLFDGLGWTTRRLFRSRSRRPQTALSWETVKLHLETGRAEGVVAEHDEALIHRIGDLNRLTAESLMIPLADLCVHPVSGTVGQLRDELVRRREPRAFLYPDEPSHLVGLVTARRLLGQDEGKALADLAGNLRQVPAHRSLLDLIDELQLAQSKFAVVTDPWGRCLGAVFLVDLLRRIVHFHQDEQVGKNGSAGRDSR